MVARKKRVPVVIDTNVFLSNILSKDRHSPNKRIVWLWWQEKQLQLIVSAEIVEEYLDRFAYVAAMGGEDVEGWRHRFEEDSRCTLVNLARRYTESRDPDDNVFLATATAGKAEYLITNDRDLLELPEEFQRALPFAIVTPRQFLRIWDAS
jgi:putative PIN family toxin of toxin-antitoxin system